MPLLSLLFAFAKSNFGRFSFFLFISPYLFDSIIVFLAKSVIMFHMKTVICKNEGISKACQLILNGELVAFPTETVYGLGANALDGNAVKKIFEAKERPQDNPLIVHLADFEDIFKVAREIPPVAFTLFEKYCPGPLTMILKKSPLVPDEVTAGLDTVGVRFPSHPMAIDLIRGSAPIAAPSANLAKHVSPTTAKHVFDDLNGRIPMILDGGECSVGIESTIIDLTQTPPVLLRPGIITLEELSDICNAEKYKGPLNVALAPGMKYKHYAPKVPCVMRDTDKLTEEYNLALASGKNPVIIAMQQTIDAFPENVNTLSLGENGVSAAHFLYGNLHSAEEIYDYVILERLPETGVFFSVMNRAKKSSAE